MATSTPPSMELDPKEVLAHLNYLGYHHITGHQLKDFMKDLKKLIRYDQMKSKENSIPSAPASPHKRKSGQQPSAAHHKKLTTEKRSSSVSSTSNLAKSSSTNPSSLNTENHKPLRPVQSKASFKPSSAASSSAPTFIRPWHMRSSSQIHKAGTSSDPVALYQHYKELWKLQPLPGEDNRSELRWKIREKMLGCNPPPRSNEHLASSISKNKKTLKKSLSFLRDPCNHPPYYVPRYKLEHADDTNQYTQTSHNYKKRPSPKAKHKTFTSPCHCVPRQEKLGFHQVKIPKDTSLDQVVNQYALPLAKKMKHKDVYISTKFQCR